MLARILLLTAVSSFSARSDFQYQSTSRMTGGSLLQMMRFVPGTGAAKEPQVSTVALHGNRLVRTGRHQAEIVDLNKRSVITVNFDKHTWSEMTFDQMKQMLQNVSAKTSARPQSAVADPNLKFDADVRETGEHKTVNGMDAHEVVVTMTISAEDAQSGQSGGMKVDSHIWLSKSVPGAAELRDFYSRMAKEIDWAPTGMGGLMNRPDMAKAMAKMMAEGGRMEGTQVQQIVTIGGAGALAANSASGAQPAPARPSVGDAIGGALGGRLGGLGGFGRKKKQDAASAEAQGGDSGSGDHASGALLEMTIDNTGFSTSPVDPSLFTVPADFKKVEVQVPAGSSR